MFKTIIWDNPEHKAQRDSVRKIILDETSEWRSHGLGMIQFKITESLRIHIWDERISRFSLEETGHKHTFDMVSYVLWGEVEHIEFIPKPGNKYRRVIFHGESQASVHSTEELVDIETLPMRIPQGKGYSMPKDAYHQFSVSGLTISLIERMNIGGNSEAFFPVESIPRPGRSVDGFGVEKEICLKVIEDARNLVDKNYGKL